MKSSATVTKGELGSVLVEFMLDSGSSVSLVQHNILRNAKGVVWVEAPKLLKLVTASGDLLQIVGHVQAPVKLGELELQHKFVVVEKLVAPVILGVDFLHCNSLVLNFTQSPVIVHHENPIPGPV